MFLRCIHVFSWLPKSIPFFFTAIHMVFQCTNMINILQLNILDEHLDFIPFYTIVKNSALFTGRTCAEAFLGPLHTPWDGCILKKAQETTSAEKEIEDLLLGM